MSNSHQLINAARKRSLSTVLTASEDFSLLMPAPILQLLDADDPDLDYVIHSIGHLRAAGLDTTDPAVLDLAVTGGRNLARASEERQRPDLVAAREAQAAEVNEYWAKRRAALSVVYYARLGNRVKIGYTTNLTNRMQNIQPEELLATERGGEALESRRHAQFDRLRMSGEWFRYEQPLIDHIASLPKTSAVQLPRLPSSLAVLFNRGMEH